tara:strand:- start:1389 stop:1823 length:435 start_codon:yes stop_codon:yes gene_type:complete
VIGLIEEFSAGIIPFDTEKNKVFLVQQRYGEHWGFAKGHIESGEEPLLAAKRELFEEGGLRVTERLIDDEFQEVYQYQSDDGIVNKRVSYFVYRVYKTEFSIDEDEIMDAGWYDIAQAMNKLTFDDTRIMFSKIVSQLEKRLGL